jgi:hypothetical protein
LIIEYYRTGWEADDCNRNETAAFFIAAALEVKKYTYPERILHLL